MIEFRDKCGRVVQIKVELPDTGDINRYHNTGGPTPDELVLALLRKVPQEEFIELPWKGR